MTKAKLAWAAVALSYVLISPAARAADDSDRAARSDSVIQDQLTHAEPGVRSGTPSNAPFANVAQDAFGNMMELSNILIGDMSPPAKPMLSTVPNQKLEEQVAIAGASDGASPSEGHMGLKPSGMGKGESGMSHMGMGVGACPMFGGRHCSPLAMLDGPDALSDDQCQKLYDIKGQFIANVVPKGLSMFMLVRRMQDLLTSSDPDTNAVKGLEKQISSAASDLSTAVMDSIVSADQVLTPGQRRKLHAHMIRSTVGGDGQQRHHDEVPHPEK